MKSDLKVCAELKRAIEDPSSPFQYLPQVNEFGVDYIDGGTSMQLIEYCPFCGGKLPESKRDLFFEAIEELGIEYELGKNDQLPKDFQSDKWWRK